MTWDRIGGRRVVEFGAVGEMRQQMLRLVRGGQKRATVCLLRDYVADSEDVEHVGEELAVVDDAGVQVMTIVVDRVEEIPFGECGEALLEADGEGFTAMTDWRDAYRRHWAAQGVAVNDSEPVVCLWFHLLPRH